MLRDLYLLFNKAKLKCFFLANLFDFWLVVHPVSEVSFYA